MSAAHRLARSGRLWFAFALLAVLAGLWMVAIQPGFRGGGFIQAILSLLVPLQAAAVYMDVRQNLWPPATPTAPIGLLAMHEAEEGVDARRFGVILGHLSAMVVIVYLFGMYVGLFAFLLAYWRLTAARSTGRALALSALFGLIVPLLFSHAVYVPLWTGIVPTVVSGYIGGSISPPL